MNLNSYLNLYQLLEEDTSSKEQRRHFGLLDESLKNRPIEQLVKWVEANRDKLKKPRLSDIFSSYLYGITLGVVLIAFFMGIFSGVALLSYSGHAPVNVVYFIAMVVFLPLLTMMLTLFSMFKAHRAQSLLVHLSPAYWLEKILALLPLKVAKVLEDIKINPLLANWIVIKRSQVVALFFSLGLLLSLLGIVATKDIAFAWSTTLDIAPEAFHSFLEALSVPWKTWLPSGVPTLELVEQSHYFRLGDSLNEEMVSHASTLGQWWKFLAMATLFYAIVLRLMVYMLSLFGFHYALKKSFLNLEGADELLLDMNEPIISSHATQKSEENIRSTQDNVQMIKELNNVYDVVQGWAMSQEELEVLNDSMQVDSPVVHDVGGTNTLEEDIKIIHQSRGEVLLYVKAWEPPTMDFVDYLEELMVVAQKVTVFPVGTAEEGYRARDRFVDIWAKKLSLLKSQKLWLKR